MELHSLLSPKEETPEETETPALGSPGTQTSTEKSKRRRTSKTFGFEPPAPVEWTAADDCLLRECMQIHFDFKKIAQKVRFSSRVKAKDVEERWAALLYDPQGASSTDDVSSANKGGNSRSKRVLWSDAEEEILSRECGSANFRSFVHVLETHRPQFHSSRTPKSLEAHYYRMKRLRTAADTEGLLLLPHSRPKQVIYSGWTRTRRKTKLGTSGDCSSTPPRNREPVPCTGRERSPH